MAEDKTRFRRTVAFGIIILLILGGVLYVWSLPHFDLSESTQRQIQRYLGDNPIVIEVCHEPNATPSYYALYTLQKRMETYAETDNITVFIHEIPKQHDIYTTRDLRIVEANYRQTFTDDNTTSLFILYVEGNYSSIRTNSTEPPYPIPTESQDLVAGLTYSDSSFAMFKSFFTDYIAEHHLPFDPEAYETSVLVHEWGHIIRLVNIGYESKFDHQTHGHHSRNPRCVMFYTVMYVYATTQDPPTDFGFQSQQDIVMLKQSSGLGSGWDILSYRLDRWKEEIGGIVAGLVLIGLAVTYYRGRKKS